MRMLPLDLKESPLSMLQVLSSHFCNNYRFETRNSTLERSLYSSLSFILTYVDHFRVGGTLQWKTAGPKGWLPELVPDGT